LLQGKPDNNGENTIFGQVFQHIKKTGYSIFKIGKDTAPFNVDYFGEGSIDVGGPYRDCITSMCQELQSTALPLLIPSPNQKNDGGLYREKWVLNPSANSQVHLVISFRSFLSLLENA